MVSSDAFITVLEQKIITLRENASGPTQRTVSTEMIEILIEELHACTRAAEVVRTIKNVSSPTSDSQKAKKAQLSRLSIVLGSWKDLVGDIPYLKTGLGLFQELTDFFK
jgi:hypothetical protein